MKIYTLVIADFADCTTTSKVFTSLKDAKAAMKEDYDEKMEECDLEDEECEYNYVFSKWHAAIREEVQGEYWMDWTIEEHEIEG